VNEAVRKLAVGDNDVIECRPADLLDDEMDKLRAECESLVKTEEDVLTYAMFPDLATTFLKERNANSLKPEQLLSKEAASVNEARYAPNEFNITLHGETFHVKLTGSGHAGEEKRPYYVSVDGIAEEVIVETLSEIEVNGKSSGTKKKNNVSMASSGRPRPTHQGCVTTAMPGTIVEVKVKAGDKVQAGFPVLVIEAMKMENEIQAPKSGVVVAVHVKKGDSVTPDESLLEIQPD
jgi:pyruvate carboxylase subunit B